VTTSGIDSQVILQFGPLVISEPVVISWGITLGIALVIRIITHRLTLSPGNLQTVVEGIVTAQESAIRAVAPGYERNMLPFIGGLWIFLVIANLMGLIPGLHSPTRDLSTTSALAILVFLSVHWFGIRSVGLKSYLQHYLSPNPIMLPFHIISEITRTVALAVRLFGNMMSLEMAALLVLMVAGFLVPIPILMLHIVEALVQSYIFGMLALIYVAGGIQSHQQKIPEPTKESS
jgi:F-type H+-transporting ATPase subunit a